jgi:hypothetical protein
MGSMQEDRAASARFWVGPGKSDNESPFVANKTT